MVSKRRFIFLGLRASRGHEVKNTMLEFYGAQSFWENHLHDQAGKGLSPCVARRSRASREERLCLGHFRASLPHTPSCYWNSGRGHLTIPEVMNYKEDPMGLDKEDQAEEPQKL